MRRWGLLFAVVSAILSLPATASAAALVPLAPGAAWDSPPIAATSPPGDPRLFVVERGGGIRIVENGVLRETPFLTVPNVDTSGERGLLSIAFAPDYATSGLFYVFTVAAGPDALDPSGEAGDLRVVEYRRSTSDPGIADLSSARLVLEQDHPGAGNHNGGQLAFGPEGLLYVTMGDGANGSNSQSLANDLGKILRIDPREQSGGVPFGVPISNPFLGTPGAKPEIYALGLRNPFRFSFAPNGDLVLPDVGSAAWEEVNLGKATGTPAATTLRGANLGWPSCEGSCVPPNPSFTDPIFQYPHDPGPPCWAIIGGYVVRDPTLTGLTGRYLYGDLCGKDLRSLDLDAAGADPRSAGISLASSGSLLGFGEDGKGCIYAMAEGTIFRVAASPGDGAACPQFPAGSGGNSSGSGESSSALGPSPSVAPPRDTTRPGLVLASGYRQPLRRTLRVFATCDEACTLGATGGLGFSSAKAKASKAVALPSSRGSGAAGERVRLSLKIKRGSFRRAQRAADRGLRVTARVQVTASDGSGNSAQRSVRIRLIPPAR